MTSARRNLTLSGEVDHPQKSDFLSVGVWPIPNDFPITFGKDSKVVSRYGDRVWRFSERAGRPIILNFGIPPQRKDRPVISPDNAELLRKVTAWLLFGPRAITTPSTLLAKFKLIRGIFVGCTQAGVLASDLYRYPIIIEQIAARSAPSRLNELVSIIKQLFDQRDRLGFYILDPSGIGRLISATARHVPRQTPYVPPRIWTHVIERCAEFVDDYNAHKNGIERCYMHMLDRFKAWGSASEPGQAAGNQPPKRKLAEAVLGESFAELASRFGILEILSKWAIRTSVYASPRKVDVRNFSLYLSMAGFVGLIHITAFSLMRINEAWTLRCDCLETREDKLFGTIHLLRGETTKTIRDSNALWVTSASTPGVVSVMSSVAHLRMMAAAANPSAPVTKEFLDNPYLVPRSYDPWTALRDTHTEMSFRHQYLSLAQGADTHYPGLFDPEVMKITREDLEIARRVNPTLDSNKFSVGEPWPLAWHQLRRTGVVNMFASGIVSESSLQHQLKHSTILMTHYYGHGFSEVGLDQSVQEEIAAAMYEKAANDARLLFGEDFVSAYGEKRKSQATSPISDLEASKLRKLAMKGTLPWRETIFGGCTSPVPCEFGGFDNMVRCGGGAGDAPCVHGIYNRAKSPELLKLRAHFKAQLLDSQEGSPRELWLRDSIKSVENMLVIMSKEAKGEQS